MVANQSPESSSLSTIDIDIGKDVFDLVNFEDEGRTVLRRKIKRLALLPVFEKPPQCAVGMKACLSAHLVSRALRALGFEPRIIPAKCTRPFVKAQKNEFNEAEGIAEAALHPNLRCVPEKSQA